MDLSPGGYFLTISHFIHLKEHEAMLHIKDLVSLVIHRIDEQEKHWGW